MRRTRKIRKAVPDPRELGARCDLCPLKGCAGPVFGQGNEDAEIAVVGEGPGMNEVDVGIPFVGRSGEQLDRMLLEAGYSRRLVWTDNATLEFPPGGNLNDFLKRKKKEAKEAGLPFHHPVDCCRPRLFRKLGIARCRECEKWQYGPPGLVCVCREPMFVKPADGLKNVKVIIPLGNAALRAFMGVEGIQKWRGSPVPLDDFAKRKGFFAFAGGVKVLRDEALDSSDEEGNDE